jgi:hypothetical protein
VLTSETAAPVAPLSSLTLKEKIDRVIGLQRQGFYLYARGPSDKVIGDNIEGTRDERWAKRTWKEFPDAVPYFVPYKFGDAESLVLVYVAPPPGVSIDFAIDLAGLPETFRAWDGEWETLVYRVPARTPLCDLRISESIDATGDMAFACLKTAGEVAELPDALLGKIARAELTRQAREAIEFGANVWEAA